MAHRAEPLIPVERRSLSDQVFSQIRDRILTGAYQAGQRLPAERTLSETLHVNRSSVREALKRLEQTNLIEIRHGEGSVVLDFRLTAGFELLRDLISPGAAPDPLAVRSMLEFRGLIGPEIARLAALRISDSELAEIEALVEAIEAAPETDTRQLQDLDFEFHYTMVRASENLALLLILNSVRGIYLRLRDSFAPMFPSSSRPLYREIAGALREHDAEMAKQVCGKLIDDGNAAFWELMKSNEA